MAETTSTHLTDRVVVVTGAGGGFGRLIAGRCAARGAKVVLGDIDEGAARAAAEEIGERAEAVGVDVTDLGQVRALVDRAVERFGAVDVMVNNAGVMPLAFFADHEQAYDAWVRCIDINLKGVLNGIVAAHDQMIRQGRGHVVNIASIYANAGTAGSGVYSATKAAVTTLSDSLRVESQGTIKVTIVRPTGVFRTGLAGGVINPAAAVGITGQNNDRYVERILASMGGTLDPALADVDDPRYWDIAPEVVADQVVHAIDQPWGVSIGDITIRATGEDFIL